MTPEAPNVERKASWRDEHLDCICGLANGQGGVLEIGRNGCGETVGVSDIFRLIEEIPNRVQSLLGIVVTAELRSDGGRDYLHIVVPSHSTPIRYRRGFPYPATALPTDVGVLREDSTRKQPENRDQPENSQKTSNQILAFLRENPEASRRDVVAELGNTTEGSVRYQLDKLKASGRLRRVGPDRGGHWAVVDSHVTEGADETGAHGGDHRRPVETQLDHSQRTTSEQPDSHQKTTRSDDQPPDPLPLTDRILALLSRNPSASRREIAATLGTTEPTVRYRLDKLRAAGKIVRIGPDKGGQWNVLDDSTTEPDPRSVQDPRSPR
ncbi:MAG: winged helix-turn-helix transcriptional regulator [Gemmatimonadetes bacterium]|nr:winged helix-turn-helix transcriptional regulator [Gemmatimonadota bacterium]MYG34545.1 winged helix-turn-helix transcriptional regulator [Gemmatimonadota bacterium]